MKHNFRMARRRPTVGQIMFRGTVAAGALLVVIIWISLALGGG